LRVHCSTFSAHPSVLASSCHDDFEIREPAFETFDRLFQGDVDDRSFIEHRQHQRNGRGDEGTEPL